VFNTAVEKLVDLTNPEIHPTAKAIKDISAGAVLVSALTAVLVGVLIFGPRLWDWIIR
jgi:diacylglycerol kinase (ATP)